MAIAFFDLDRTLIDVNSATLWVKREFRTGHLSKTMALRAGFSILLYELGRVNIEHMIEKAVASLTGVSEDVITERTQAFYDEEISMAYRRGGLEALEKHRVAGDQLVLLTGSSIYLSRAAQKQHDLDAVLCNRFVVEDGVFTGKAETPVCYGAGKVHHAQNYADSQGIALEDCTFYSDSYSDLPALLACGKGVVVAPDQRLARAAAKEGLSVEDWGLRA